MADMGADVIKVEPPQGDNTRYISVGPAPGMSGVFVNVNRGKRGIVLDLQTDAGTRALRALVETADVFVHSMRAKAIAKLGFGYEDVAAINPAIVYTNCYGYGRRGPGRIAARSAGVGGTGPSRHRAGHLRGAGPDRRERGGANQRLRKRPDVR